jgi:alpha,alpha-trehalose phosphorylase
MLAREPRTAPEYIYPVDEWRIVEQRFAPRYLGQTETIFALSNGYLGMRGSFEEGRPVFESGTYVNGFHETWPIPYGETAYGFAKTGQTMLNVTDAKLLKLYVDDEPFAPEYAHMLEYERVLDMRRGVLERSVLWETPAGKKVEIRTTRLVSFAHRHLAAIDYQVTVHEDAPVVLASEMRVPTHTSSQEGDPRRGRGFEERVLLAQYHDRHEQRIVQGHRTRNSGMTMACGVDHLVHTDCDYTIDAASGEDAAKLIFSIRSCAGKTFRVTKFMTYHTSHSSPAGILGERAERTLDRAMAGGWEELLASQEEFLAEKWRLGDVQIKGDARVQQSIRWNLFQLIQASSRAEGAGIGARGLTGQTYEGHYFWDTEIYVLPYLVHTTPRIARNLLRFRHAMLDKARERAQEVGEQGALFPWRTINGEEASAYYAAGTAQYHINADIVHAIRKYVDISGDQAFLHEHGAEILVETARLWRSLGFFSEQRGGQFCIHAVTGPDEYNTVVNNNLFTNLMARQNLRYAAEVMTHLRDHAPEHFAALVHRTGFKEREAEEWRTAADAMLVPYDEKNRIHLQDDGFLAKQPWDFEATPADHYPLLLHYHPLVIYRHRVIKQADVVMAMFLLSDEFDDDAKRRNFDYYDPLTTGDSSLSVCIQSILASEIGYQEEAYRYFRYAVLMDLGDLGGNVREGAHIAAIGGTWMTLVYGFAGLREDGGRIAFDPRLPQQWDGMRFQLTIRGQELIVDMNHDHTDYTLGDGPDLVIQHQHRDIELSAGKTVTVTVEHLAPGYAETYRELIPASSFDAVLFDMDGVITATSEVHADAWKRMFDAYLKDRAKRSGELFRPFEIGTDYLLHVDGKPRQDGVRDFLASRGIELPKGQPEDSPETETQWGLGNRKNALVNKIIREEGVKTHATSIDLVRRLRESGIRTAIVTSSTNCDVVLESAGIADLFEVKVDGVVAEERQLAGKPAPDTYLEAAEQLGVEPGRCVVVEDAIAGVAAARDGGFRLVIGVARAANADELSHHGADVVLGDLGVLLPED